MNNEIKNSIEGEGETMLAKVMSNEYAEALAMLEKANSAFARIFGTQEGEGEGDE